MRQACLVSVIALVGFACSAIRKQEPIKPEIEWQQQLGYEPNEIFPISIGRYGFPYVKAQVDGHEVELVWDLGCMSKLVLAPRIAKRFGLAVSGESRSYESSGDLLGIYKTYTVRKLEILGSDFDNQIAHESHHPGRLDGLVGPDYVYPKRFTLDYRRKVLAVSSSPLPAVFPKDRILPLIQSPAERHRSLVLVKGKVNGREVICEIDTGKSRTTVDIRLVRSLNLPEVRRGYEIREVQLGPYSFSVPSAKESDFSGISEGLSEPILLGVGSDILSQLVTSVDYGQQIMVVSKSIVPLTR